ncbi:hypothetical protein ABN702_07645 [Bacillus haimaensis]|uniref:coiled-coil domain-containing protein n=1 Tax=Bacillus haimaensis TaxID=3160967 RepID=UPI003AA88950
MTKIPDVVLANNKCTDKVKWIEEHDRYIGKGQFFDNTNQLDWWKINSQIREAFDKIEQEINRKLKNNKHVSVRIVSWSRIASLANCDRNTIKHKGRYHWTFERRTKLIEKIKNEYKNTSQENEFSEIESLKNEELNEKLIKIQSEVAKWVYKYKDAEEEIKQLNKLISYKSATIDERNNQIKELRIQLKAMMKSN